MHKETEKNGKESKTLGPFDLEFDLQLIGQQKKEGAKSEPST